MKVLIVEDEKPAARQLQRLLADMAGTIQIAGVIDTVEDTVNWLKTHPEPDLIFLDIHLADGYSFEIFQHVQSEVPVIFTTAYDEYALRAFDLNSIDYLLKPIDSFKLARSLNKFRNRKVSPAQPAIDIQKILQQLQVEKTYKSRLLIKQKDKLISVEDTHIAYFQANSKLVVLITFENRVFSMDYTIDEFERQMDPQRFFRLNRSIFANRDAIAGIYKHFNGKLKIDLSPPMKEDIFVSREKADAFRQWMEY
ncbi:MAG: LytTR family DNA-binding domain-containing protein [Cyclobacteriaceae bacterium]|nr:LytTR family DNA-binding domain-containing protein [Cyclobacteriaceae bacterium]